MKPTLNCLTATETPGTRVGLKRLTSKSSFQNRSRQGITAANVRPSIRSPVSPLNRAYLKALRQAELAAWETPNRATTDRAGARRGSGRLPSPGKYTGENWMYALVATLAAISVGFELWRVFQAGGNWHNFVQFVRQLVA